jgi:hypothetical protein
LIQTIFSIFKKGLLKAQNQPIADQIIKPCIMTLISILFSRSQWVEMDQT